MRFLKRRRQAMERTVDSKPKTAEELLEKDQKISKKLNVIEELKNLPSESKESLKAKGEKLLLDDAAEFLETP